MFCFIFHLGHIVLVTELMARSSILLITRPENTNIQEFKKKTILLHHYLYADRTFVMSLPSKAIQSY